MAVAAIRPATRNSGGSGGLDNRTASVIIVDMDTLIPLFRQCRQCRETPTHRTRQRAVAARPMGRWFQVCTSHLPGSRLHLAPVVVQAMSAALHAHETEPLRVA